MIKVRQYVPREQVALRSMRITRQNERLHAERGVSLQLAEHLARVADDGGTRPGAPTADAGPQVRLSIALVIGRLTQFILPHAAGGGGVQGPPTDPFPRLSVKTGDQTPRRSPRFGLGIADDDVGAV